MLKEYGKGRCENRISVGKHLMIVPMFKGLCNHTESHFICNENKNIIIHHFHKKGPSTYFQFRALQLNDRYSDSHCVCI